MAVVSMKQLLEAGVHFGHQTRRWNPKMAPYIYTERNGIYIIDLQKTVKKIEEAYNFIRDVSTEGGAVLFVGTKKQAADSIREEAERCGMYFVNARWLGGMLTNYKTIRKRIDRLVQLRKMEGDGTFDVLPKKEVIKLTGEIERILFLNERMPAVLIGLGNLGRALMGYLTYEAKGISLIGLFDQSPKNVTEINPDIEVMNIKQLDDFCTEHRPTIAILCIPETNAQQMAERLVSLGVRGFWNFSHVDLRLPDEISVENVHLGDSLMTLDFQVQTKLQSAK